MVSFSKDNDTNTILNTFLVVIPSIFIYLFLTGMFVDILIRSIDASEFISIGQGLVALGILIIFGMIYFKIMKYLGFNY